MEKKTLLSLIAVVLLGAVAFAVMRSPEKGQRKGPPARPIAAFKSADVTALEVTSEKQEKVSLAKKDGKWQITAPKEWAADGAGIKSLLEGLERLGFQDVVTEGKEKHEELGVVEGKAVRVVAKGGSGTLADFFMGKSIAGFTMIRPAGSDKVYQGTGMYAYMVNRDAKGWRDHLIFEFPAADAEKLLIEGGGAKLALEKVAPEAGAPAGGEAKWKIAESSGDAPKTSDALDTAMVNGAVQAMATLRAADFAEDKKPEDLGLAAPGVKVTATAKGGKTYQLLIGNTVGEDMFVKTGESPILYSVKKFSLERVAHRPIDYRDKTLVKVKEQDLASVDITVGAETTALERAGDKWKGKGKPVDEAKLKPVVSSFDNLAGSGFAEEKDPAKTGLNKPSGQVVLRLKDKSTVTLKIGALTKDQADYHVQKAGSPDILLVKKYAIDRFLKKPSDLTSEPKKK
jgi:hypothetical protein